MSQPGFRRRKRALSALFGLACATAAAVCVLMLLVVVGSVLWQGAGRVSIDFLSRLPSRFADKTGIFTALMGSLWLMVLTCLIAVPVGVGAALYLEGSSSGVSGQDLTDAAISGPGRIAKLPTGAFGMLCMP